MRISIRASMLVWLSAMLASPGLLHGLASSPSYGVWQHVYPIAETFSPALGIPDPLVPWQAVTSVDWCCDGYGKYLAVGDGNLGAFVFVFAPQDVGNEFPTIIPVPAPTSGWGSVNSVAWCCTGTTKYLAVGDGGQGGSGISGAYAYSFEPTSISPLSTAILAPAPSNPGPGTWFYVDSVAWCYDGTTAYLAVGDGLMSGAYVYSFDGKGFPSGPIPVLPAPTSGWQHVDSVAWCYDGATKYLAVGDYYISGAYAYSFDPTQAHPFSAAIPVPAPSNPGPGSWYSVSSVAWCYDGTTKYLAVGDYYISGAYAYSFDPTRAHPFSAAIPVPAPSNPGPGSWYSVSSVAWCYDGTTKYLAVGDRGHVNPQTSGAYTYSFDGESFPVVPIFVPAPKLDGWQVVDSVAWCCDGTNKYLAVGDTGNGHPGTSGAYAYSFDASATPSTCTKTIQDPLPVVLWNISSVAWFCSGIYAYLAVANQGVTPGVFVFSFNSITGAFMQTSTNPVPQSFSWQAPSNVAWCCGGSSIYLAVTDPSAPSYLPLVFQFDRVGEIFTSITVNPPKQVVADQLTSSSLCCDATDVYLAVAYTTEVFAFVLTNNVFNPVQGGPLVDFSAVSSISWRRSGRTKFLAVGDAGNPSATPVIPSSVNAYSFDPTQATPFGSPISVPVPTSITNFGAVRSIAWCCDGTNSYLAVGDAGTSVATPSGAYVYRFDQVHQVFSKAIPVPAPAGGWSHVDSVAWCCAGNGTCLAVGDAGTGAYGYSFNGTTGMFTPIKPNPMPSSGTWGTVSSVDWCCGSTSSCLAVADRAAGRGAYVYCLQGNDLIVHCIMQLVAPMLSLIMT